MSAAKPETAPDLNHPEKGINYLFENFRWIAPHHHNTNSKLPVAPTLEIQETEEKALCPLGEPICPIL
jgi:hypothetical protein